MENSHNRTKPKTNELCTDVPSFQAIPEFGGALGSLFLILFLPLFLGIYPYLGCDETQCSLFQIPAFTKFTNLSNFFNLPSILLYQIFAILQGVLMHIPCGEEVTMRNKRGNLRIFMNGFTTLWIYVFLLFFLETCKFEVVEFIINHLLHLSIGSIIFASFVSSYVYKRSFYSPTSDLNERTVQKDVFSQFFLGREMNPSFMNIDLKYYFMRLTVVPVILVDMSFLYNHFVTNESDDINATLTLGVLCMFHFIYFTDILIFELAWLTSFEIKEEGFGFMSVCGYALYPFMMICQTKYLVDRNIKISLGVLFMACCVFGIGYFIFRKSNNQKNLFRMKPNDPSVANLKTITTKHGKKLLVSGYWGIVRHPNYLGDILIQIAFVFFFYNGALPLLPSLMSITTLFHRITRIHANCNQKYGHDWTKYCRIVKYKLVPYIY